MKVVIDANVLFAALIKDSFTCQLLFNRNIELYMPQFLIDELREYEELILKKTKRSREDYIKIIHILQDIIKAVPKEMFEEFLEQGRAISPDEDDFMYFALALKMDCGIWSNDKKLKEQKRVAIYNTKELFDQLSK